MAELKMPEINSVTIAGNLTKDPAFKETSKGMSLANLTIACNRRFKDSSNHWQEEVCYVNVVAWNKLADTCKDNLYKGCAVLVDGELQSRIWKQTGSSPRTVIEIKARRIQFLNKKRKDDSEIIKEDDQSPESGTSTEDNYGYKNSSDMEDETLNN